MIRRPPISTLFPYPTPFQSPDIATADSIATWPTKAAQLSLIAVDMAWSIGKALISAWVTKMTEPENRREIAFGQPGEFLIRCLDRKSTRLNSSHANISYAVF